MPLLHPGAPFPELSLTVPGRATVKVPEMFGCQFGVMLLYRGSWCPYCNAQLRAFQHISAAPARSEREVWWLHGARGPHEHPFAASRRSVLDLADACDVPSRWACRTGVCHTCTTP